MACAKRSGSRWCAAKLKKRPEPVNLILFNLASGEKDCFEPGLFAYLSRKPFFGPLWKAAGLSLLVVLIFWAVSKFHGARRPRRHDCRSYLAIMFGFLTYPVFWWLCGLWDRLTERMRYKNARKSFIAEMEARVRAYAPGGA